MHAMEEEKDHVVLMTVKELIRELRKMKPSAEVLCREDRPGSPLRPLALVSSSNRRKSQTANKVYLVFCQ